MSLTDWHQYLIFLRIGDANVQALHVIDYLDNLHDARNWVTKRLKSGQTEKELMNIIKHNTIFTSVEVSPVFHARSMMESHYLTINISRLPPVNYYLYSILKTSSKRNIYHQLNRYSYYTDIPTQLLRDAKMLNFIFKPFNTY